MKKVMSIGMLAVALAVSGCALERVAHQEASASMEPTADRLTRTDRSFVERDGAFLGGAAVDVTPKARLPGLEAPVQVSFDESIPAAQMVAFIARSNGVMIDIASDAQEAFREKTTITGFTGSVAAFLDTITLQTGTSWEVADGRVVVYQRRAVVYSLYMPMAPTDATASVSKRLQTTTTTSGVQSVGASTGSAGSEMKQVVKADGFKDLEDAIKAVLTKDGRMSVSVSTGTLVVTDTPSTHEAVRTIVDAFNDRVRQQVMFDVSVYEVSLTDSESAGLRWDLVWESLNSRYEIRTASGEVPGPEQYSVGFGVIDPTFSYGGSQVLVNALQKQGSVTVLKRAVLSATNRRPTALHINAERVYLAGVSTSVVANAGIVRSIEPGLVNTGFSLSLASQVVSGNQIMVDMVLDLSSLVALRRVTSGADSIEAPERATQQSMPSVLMRTGETVVLAGFDLSDLRGDTSGVTKATHQWLGGGRSGARTRSVIVVELTSRVI